MIHLNNKGDEVHFHIKNREVTEEWYFQSLLLFLIEHSPEKKFFSPMIKFFSVDGKESDRGHRVWAG